jgi:2-methylaconitate cis-trans-isomerase PrpF
MYRSSEQLGTPAVLYRGGTSKAFIVQAKDLPSDDRDRIADWVLAVYGSPDRRQIDGVGGADGLTSKFAIIGPSSRENADLDYTFAQIGIEEATIDWSLICGNITAAIGHFAIDEGLVAVEEPETVIGIHNTNTGKIIECIVGVRNGYARVIGDAQVEGVPGTGAPILLDFKDTASTRGMGLLPTGKVRDRIEIADVGAVDFTVVDAAIPVMFVAASSFGLTGSESPLELEANKDALTAIDAVRRAVSAKLGWASSPEAAYKEAPHAPASVIVGPPADWIEFGSRIARKAKDADCTVRALGAKNVHKAYFVTGSIATTIAASLSGSVLHEVCHPESHAKGCYRLAHPSGVLATVVDLEQSGTALTLRRAAIVRTARRIMDGTVYASGARLPWAL